MEVLPYFLPDEEPPPEADATSPHDRPYFLFVGRLERIKGLDDVIPLFREYPDADLLVAGDGQHGEVLEGLAADSPRVRFLGRVAPDALPRYYRHALALIVPSVCFETFGIIIIEAFRHGIPVVARRLGPFPEIIEAAGGGVLFETNSELLAALRRIQDDESRRREMGRAGFEAWKARWSESAVVPLYLDIVRRAAERRGRLDVLARLNGEQVA
jgi:glycosyltransferase involved in cell wall biosynthesis